MSGIQKRFLKWFEEEKNNGLIDIKFTTGNLYNATVDSFLLEIEDMIKAYKDGKCTPLPEDF